MDIELLILSPIMLGPLLIILGVSLAGTYSCVLPDVSVYAICMGCLQVVYGIILQGMSRHWDSRRERERWVEDSKAEYEERWRRSGCPELITQQAWYRIVTLDQGYVLREPLFPRLEDCVTAHVGAVAIIGVLFSLGSMWEPSLDNCPPLHRTYFVALTLAVASYLASVYCAVRALGPPPN